MPKNYTIVLDKNVDPHSHNTETLNNKQETEIKAQTLWQKFIELLSDTLKPNEINTWFSVITPKSLENNVLTIKVPSEDYYSLIESRYNSSISKKNKVFKSSLENKSFENKRITPLNAKMF